MSKKSRVSDEQIIELIEKGLINSHIARELGVTLGSISVRCNQLRKKHNSLPEPAKKSTKRTIDLDNLPEVEPPPSLKEKASADTIPPEPVKLDPFPFEPKDDVIYGGQLHRVRSVGATRMILCRNADLKSVTITLEEWNRNKDMIRAAEEKPQNTYEHITRNRPDEEPEDAKAPETIFEKVAIRSKAEKKPAQSVENLFQPDPADAAIESAPVDAGPIHIDLEMDDSADLVELPRGEQDYVDPEWFDKPIPRKGTVERAIWDKAYQEISEIQTLRATIQTALSRGDRLPAAYVDKYNKYVSKYSGEVGA